MIISYFEYTLLKIFMFAIIKNIKKGENINKKKIKKREKKIPTIKSGMNQVKVE